METIDWLIVHPQYRRHARTLPGWLRPAIRWGYRRARYLYYVTWSHWFRPMTGRALRRLFILFVTIAVCYVLAWLVWLPKEVRDRLSGINTFIFGIPAALLAYAFQLRLNHLRRVDSWLDRLAPIEEAILSAFEQYEDKTQCAPDGRWVHLRISLCTLSDQLTALVGNLMTALRIDETWGTKNWREWGPVWSLALALRPIAHEGKYGHPAIPEDEETRIAAMRDVRFAYEQRSLEAQEALYD